MRARRGECNVQGYRNGAFSQIKENPGPASLGLHSVKGRASTQVVSEGGADSDTMIFQRLEAGCVGDFPHFLEGLGFGEQPGRMSGLVSYAKRSEAPGYWTWGADTSRGL
jgi:hypothetical protein